VYKLKAEMSWEDGLCKTVLSCRQNGCPSRPDSLADPPGQVAYPSDGARRF